MQFIIAERTAFVSERAIIFASWLAKPASHAFALLAPSLTAIVLPAGLFNAAGLAVLSPLRHTCDAK